MSTDLIETTHPIATRHESTELSVDVVLDRMNKVQDLMARAMRLGIDYGSIPGTNSKPTLLKPGAEKLCVMFRLAPKYRTTKHFHDDGHLTVESTCQIYDMDDNFLGEASAMCSTREAKYAYRKSERVCPKCGKPAVITGKKEFGGGYLCWKKKDGCGAKFSDDDPTITTQVTGRVPNDDLADSYNTVLRISEKRSLIGAVRLVTGSSALFDEEIPGAHGNEKDDANGDAPPPTPAPRRDKPAPRRDAARDDPPQPDAATVAEWTTWLDGDPSLAEVNARMPLLARETSKMTPATRVACWELTTKHAADVWVFSAAEKKFALPNNATFGSDAALGDPDRDPFMPSGEGQSPGLGASK